MSAHEHEPMMTETEVAHLLKCSVKTLRNARVSGRGPKWHKLGRNVRYTMADVMEWVRNGKAGGVAVLLAGMLMDYS